MKSLYFITTTIIVVILSTLLVHGQSTTTIPPKCCNPMHMPVNGQCKRVECRNDDQCAAKFQSYCTKYNKGQSICRGISGVCGCNGEQSEIDKKPSGLNCPAKQECKSDGKCGLIEQKCTDPKTVPLNGQCQEVNCRNDAQCARFQSYCTKFKLGQAICRVIRNCGCNGETTSRTEKPIGYCNYNLGDSDKCGKGNICLPHNRCGPPPKCAFYGKECHPTTNKCCDKGAYCHKRSGSSYYSCVNTAFVNDDCSGSILCEYGSSCINNKCSLRDGDSCDFKGAVCPHHQECRYSTLATGTNKLCDWKK